MKKQYIFIFILILIILGGISYLFFSGKKAKTVTPPSTLVVTGTYSNMSTMFQNTFLSGKTQQCTVQNTNGSSEKYYMTGVTVRADFSSPHMNQKVHLYADGETVYVWVGSEIKGISVPEINPHAINAAMQTSGMSNYDVNAKRDLQCSPWTVDHSVLGAPYTVNFTPGK